jgi:hypothetical protein
MTTAPRPHRATGGMGRPAIFGYWVEPVGWFWSTTIHWFSFFSEIFFK